MTAKTEVQPRKWDAFSFEKNHWSWKPSESAWCWCNWLGRGRIFVPGTEPMPTIDPAGMDELKTCRKVDWI